MNIFFLCIYLENIAAYHCDKHVVKMILETTQLLYTTIHITSPNLLNNSSLKVYRKTHENHPCALWVRESIYNYKYLVALGLYLCNEYNYRYNKIHACYEHLIFLYNLNPNLNYIYTDNPYGITTPKPVSKTVKMYKENYDLNDVINFYRYVYKTEKRDICKWTKRETPIWFLSI